MPSLSRHEIKLHLGLFGGLMDTGTFRPIVWIWQELSPTFMGSVEHPSPPPVLLWILIMTKKRLPSSPVQYVQGEKSWSGYLADSIPRSSLQWIFSISWYDFNYQHNIRLLLSRHDVKLVSHRFRYPFNFPHLRHYFGSFLNPKFSGN